MRILILSDIHANWPALQALDEPFDVCFFLGDLVDYLLEPAECLEWIRQHAHVMVRGNHDHGAAQNVLVTAQRGFKYLTSVTRPLTRERLSPEELRFLGSMPVTRMVTLEETRYFLVHATPRDPLDEYAPADAAYWRERLQGVDADVICVGHTHQPYVLEVDDKIVVNPGSLGLPRDGDPRGSYAILDDHEIELKRLAYPIEDALRVVDESSLPEQAKVQLGHVLRTGGSFGGPSEVKVAAASEG